MNERSGYHLRPSTQIRTLRRSVMTPQSIRLALGGDHAGFVLKQAVADRYANLVTDLVDCGTHDQASCDYPDFAVAVSKQLLAGKAEKGLLICGSGVGASVAANKIPGIRAAICH